MADSEKTLTVHIATTGDPAGIQKIDDAIVDLAAADAKRTAEQERAYQEFQAEKKQLIAEESRLKEAAAAKEKADFEAFSDRFDKDQQKRQAAAEKALATEEKAREKSERNALAEETAAAAKTTALLNRIHQLRELATEATSAGKEIQAAYNAVSGDAGAAMSQLELVGKAGVDAAGTIAAAWAAGGPVAAVISVIVQLKDGLAELFTEAESLASIQAGVAEETATRVEAAAARIAAALRSDTKTDGRENALKAKQTADKADADTAREKEAEARREKEKQDLDRREITDPVQRKEAEVSDRAKNEASKTNRETSKLQAQIDNERKLREDLGKALAAAEAERDRLIADTTRLAGLPPSEAGKKAQDGNIKNIAQLTQERERINADVSKSNEKAAELQRQQQAIAANYQADAGVNARKGNLDLNDTRRAEEARAARQAEAEARTREAEDRRKKSGKTVPGQRCVIDNEESEGLADGALAFVKKNTSAIDRLGGGNPKLNNATEAAKALKDGGSTAPELRTFLAAFDAMSGTILASKKEDAAIIARLTAVANKLTKDLAATDGRVKNNRP